MNFTESSIEVKKDFYLALEDIDFIVSNGDRNDEKFSLYFYKSWNSIPLQSFHPNNPESDKRQFGKLLFKWINNYNRDLTMFPIPFAMICYLVFYGDISVRDARTLLDKFLKGHNQSDRK